MNNPPIMNDHKEKKRLKELLQELIKEIIDCRNTGIIFNKTHYPVFTIVLEELKHDSYGHKHGGVISEVEVTSANHQDNSVSLKFDWEPEYETFNDVFLSSGTIKAILAKKASTTDLKKQILSIDDDTLEYIIYGKQ